MKLGEGGGKRFPPFPQTPFHPPEVGRGRRSQGLQKLGPDDLRERPDGKEDKREKSLILIKTWFIIAKIFLKEVIPGASARAHDSQEVLKPRCLGGLGKARIPKPLDEAGEDRLGLGLHKVSFSTISLLSFLR